MTKFYDDSLKTGVINFLEDAGARYIIGFVF